MPHPASSRFVPMHQLLPDFSLLARPCLLKLRLSPGTLQLASGLRGSCQPLRCWVFSWGAGEMRESCLHQGLLPSAKPQEAGISAPPHGDTVQVSVTAGDIGSQLKF